MALSPAPGTISRISSSAQPSGTVCIDSSRLAGAALARNDASSSRSSRSGLAAAGGLPMVYWKISLAAETSPSSARSAIFDAIRPIRSGVTWFSSSWRSAATCREYGLPGPPLLPAASRPSPARPSGAVAVAVSDRDMTDLTWGRCWDDVIIPGGGPDGDSTMGECRGPSAPFSRGGQRQPVERTEVDPQDVAVEEQDCRQGLVLRAGRDPVIHAEVGEERLDVGGAESAGCWKPSGVRWKRM